MNNEGIVIPSYYVIDSFVLVLDEGRPITGTNVQETKQYDVENLDRSEAHFVAFRTEYGWGAE
ncbi:hypothetical protein BFJ69_g16826 [Fusarium oxysporum]|uniref:Uncharacterized protein n=1 Tax=Fusarium oxysporum TaxID=5507 RepID=A0A420MA10_FUSOX|nr:hypothetical protein BFJ69_g16826 [Fusarium oxysporum]